MTVIQFSIFERNGEIITPHSKSEISISPKGEMKKRLNASITSPSGEVQIFDLG